MMKLLKGWLTEPLTRGLNIDDPQTTLLRQQIIQQKKCLHRIYQEWYAALAGSLPPGDGPVLEIGSGAGFLREFVPEVIASDLLSCLGIQLVLDAKQIPVADAGLRAIVLIDVLYHLPNVRSFFREASRCVRSGGAVVMIEPWVTPWSRWVYRRFHHEAFEPEAVEWEFPSHGPLSSANMALPWILFERDADKFVREFPSWQIKSIRPIMPFQYLLSGGVSMRSVAPGWSFGVWSFLERLLEPRMHYWAMFAQIVMIRNK